MSQFPALSRHGLPALALALFATCVWSAPGPAGRVAGTLGPADGVHQQAGTAAAATEASPPSTRSPTPAQRRHVDAGGLYSLSGIMEVGSQLRLRADGRFEWMLAYGAMDQAAQGRWRRDGDRVLLVADPPGASGAVFAPQPPRPWDEDSEGQLRDAGIRLAEETALARCPFLRGDAYAATPAPLDDTPPTQGMLDRHANDAQASLRTATVGLERAAAAAMAAQSHGSGPSVDAAMAQARSAMDDYQMALLQLGPAFEQAGRDTPTMPEPRYPPECMPPSRQADVAPAAPWRGGYAVVVGDPRQDLPLRGIAVAFEFSDGRRVDAVTNDAGWAGVARRGDVALATVRLALRDGARPAERFPIGSRDSRLYPYAIDSAGLIPPAFGTMALRIDGDDLVPTWPDGDERGRYSHD